MEHYSLNRNLQRLLILRAIMLAGGVVATIFAYTNLQAKLHPVPIFATYIVMFLVGLGTWARLKRPMLVSEGELFKHLLFDVLALTIILHSAGGSANPFTCLLLVPVTLAAAALPRTRTTWGMVLSANIAYLFLLVDTSSFQNHAHGSLLQSTNLHSVGMWLSFVFSSCLIAVFAVSMNNQLRQRDLELAKQREQALRDQQLVELGTLAAGAAHELGTPLGTMAIIAGELESDYAKNSEVSAKAHLLKEQIKRCKQSLSVLSLSAGQLHANSGQAMPIDEYLIDLIENWKKSRSDNIFILHTLLGPKPGPNIVAELTLTHAITNILNNAADASPREMEFIAKWDDDELTLKINDRGRGFDEKVKRSLGRSRVVKHSGEDGLGIGFLLAHSTLSRLGGNISVANRPGGGTSTTLYLPLAVLAISRGENNDAEQYNRIKTSELLSTAPQTAVTR